MTPLAQLHPNCINFSTCQIEKLMQFGWLEAGSGHAPILPRPGARVAREMSELRHGCVTRGLPAHVGAKSPPPALRAGVFARNQHQALELGDEDAVLVEDAGVDFDDAAV